MEYCPETVNAAKISSRVYVAKLFDIVALYNHIGTELFARNVRYHIADALNVESEIQETLEAYPEDFFQFQLTALRFNLKSARIWIQEMNTPSS